MVALTPAGKRAPAFSSHFRSLWWQARRAPRNGARDRLAGVTITGSPGNDRVRVLLDHSGQHVTVVAGGQKIAQFDLAALSSIQFNGFAGNDFFSIDRHITVNALAEGGAGNDVLIGGGGRNVLIGGDGRDVLIAGLGGDLLIAGTTAYDTDPVALNQILLEWGSADSYKTRVAKLQTGDGVPKLDAKTVFDDGVRDVLVGGPGLDWFFATLPDRIHHHVPAEQVN